MKPYNLLSISKYYKRKIMIKDNKYHIFGKGQIPSLDQVYKYSMNHPICHSLKISESNSVTKKTLLSKKAGNKNFKTFNKSNYQVKTLYEYRNGQYLKETLDMLQYTSMWSEGKKKELGERIIHDKKRLERKRQNRRRNYMKRRIL